MEAWLKSLAVDAEPSMDECVAILGKELEWLHELKHTSQDPEWHGEGDVHVHTGMVLDALYLLLRSEAQHIRGLQRQALILGAVLHDIGKPRRTQQVEIRGVPRIASPKHEEVGRNYLAIKLMSLPLAYEVIWTVLGLVGEHHMPKLLVVKNASKGGYLTLSRRVDTELLYWLEVADMRGRICPDLSKQLGLLEEFKLFADEYDVWGKAYQPRTLDSHIKTETPQAQRYLRAMTIADMQNDQVVQEEECLARHFRHKENYAHLVVLCGPSGAGKSTYVSQHFKHYQLISLDEIREEISGNRSSQKSSGQVMQLAKRRLKVALSQKADVVWDATNLRQDFRKIIVDFGKDYHALVTLVVFSCSETALRSGNANRRYSIPDTVLTQQLSKYQFPVVDEAHEYLVIGEKGVELFAC
ncbi:AAA family ATPase [Thaumasiovibrio subtropicus]|uniref:AAA family ATPase n=1 Tax=Thaumasiovibrio subtropicus TaxID=1891207 RepID=UPI000B35E822|nr:AAA family ATPase [Thaumasiovibrio subtropicus]